ncbi:MAG: SpoIIE family protein phosphatase [Bacteroidetes bacterium]|nr:SpoIIE family protein phosphatase [Bacteroidota bacterium]
MQLKIKYLILLIVFVFLHPEIHAQDGTPFITHFKEAKEIESQNWSISQDNQNVMLFANRKGLLTFDGHKWDLHELPYIPFALKKSPFDNKVYVGANNNYGYLERNSKGTIEYKSLSDSAQVGIITKIIFTDTTIFFYGERTITRHSIKDPEKFKRWNARRFKPFTGMFTTNRNTFFNVFGEGLYRLESDTLFPIVTGFYTENSEILFSLPYSNTRVLVGTDESKLYTFDGIKYYNYNIDDEGYLKESILADGQIISDTLYAFGTLYGGVEIVNKKTGKIVSTINYQNGLPDDEIYSLGLDNNNGLWISHEFGVSRVDFNLPIRNYTTYPGLKGNLITTVWHNNELYVATNEGIFYLTEVKDYNEVSIWVKKSPAQSTSVSAESSQNKKSDKSEEKSPVKKLFSKLFGNKSEEKEEEKTQPSSEIKKETTSSPKPHYVKKTVSKLKSINYIYKKVEGLNDKCNQLVSTNHGILVASTNGLYNIKNYKTTEIVKNRYINQISNKTPEGNYFISTSIGFFTIMHKDGEWTVGNNFVNFAEPVYTVNFLSKHNVWIGGDDKTFSFSLDSLGEPRDLEYYAVKTPFPEQYKLDFINDTLILFLESGLFYFDQKTDSFKTYYTKLNEKKSRYKFLLNQQNLPWIRIDNKWTCLNTKHKWDKQEISFLKLFDDISSIISDDKNNLWIINNYNQIFKINHQRFRWLKPDFNIFFNKIKNQDGITFQLSDLTFDPENKAIYVSIIAPYYVKKNSTQYQYYVEGLMNNWSDWSINQDINLIVESGEYTLHVRAQDIWGNRSEIKSLDLTIKPPFTKTIGFYVIIGLAAIVLFIFILRVRERKLKYDKKILEQKVKERTIEIEEKAEEIKSQRDEILDQKEEITASITYAKRIQNAILPMKDHFSKVFTDHFILYKPRDIVSGDFYWIAEDNHKVYFTAADCTGHGVPGAFMSMLGISSLNEIMSHKAEKITANKFLNHLREKIKFSLHQTGKEGENKDGMDMAMCILHKDKNLLEYAGAYNPLYLIRNGELIEYKADRMPVGIYHVEKGTFTNNEIKIQKNDIIYIFSDGYADQFGGPAQTKFKSGNVKKLLLEICSKPMEEQKQILEERFNKWKGKTEQVDDIIFIGIRF